MEINGKTAAILLGTFFCLTGSARAQPQLKLIPPAIDFGTIETKATATELLVLSNAGAANLEITDFEKSGSANFFLDAASPEEPCESETPQLNPGQSCQIAVNFSPSGTEPFSATLTFTSNDPIQPAMVVTLAGTGQGGDCSLGHSATTPKIYLIWILILAIYLTTRYRSLSL